MRSLLEKSIYVPIFGVTENQDQAHLKEHTILHRNPGFYFSRPNATQVIQKKLPAPSLREQTLRTYQKCIIAKYLFGKIKKLILTLLQVYAV